MQEAATHADQIAEELRRAIIARVYPPGERLSAQTLAERFKVSQTPMREAFARLAGEGWVKYHPQRGVRVADVSIDDLVDIYELRELLEPLAMRRSVEGGDESWRKLVQEAYDEMMRLSDSEPTDLGPEGYQGYELAHTHFHRTLIQECGSHWLVRFTNLLIDQSARYQPLTIPVRDRTGSLRNEHNYMRLAALAGDAHEVEIASQQHMQNTKKEILRWLAENEHGSDHAATSAKDAAVSD